MVEEQEDITKTDDSNNSSNNNIESEQVADSTLIDDVYSEVVDKILRAEEKRRKKLGLTIEEAEKLAQEEINIEQEVNTQICPNPRKVLLDPYKRRTEEQATIWRKKPIPYAVSIARIMKIYNSWENLGFNPKFKPIFAMQYLTGTRISEVLSIRKGDIDFTTTFDNLGRPVEFMEVYAINLKQGKKRTENTRMYKQLVCPAYGEEKQMVYDLKEYVKKFSENEFIFQITRRAFEYMQQGKIDPHARIMVHRHNHKINFAPIRVIEVDGRIGYRNVWLGSTHYLRRCRLTHLATVYGWNETLIKDFAGWTSTAMLPTYVNISGEDMKKKFIEKMK